MSGVNKIYPIQPVTFYDRLMDNTKQGEPLPLDPAATFPGFTIVRVDAGVVKDFDPANQTELAVSQEPAVEPVMVEAGPQLFASKKSSAYVWYIGDKRLVMSASWTGGTPVIYDPATHEGHTFNGAIDPNSGFVFIDLANVDPANAPFTIEGLYECPSCPDPTNTALDDEERYNALVVVTVNPTAVYTG